MKKLLIVGSAPNNILDKNINKLRKYYNQNKWELNILLTKKYNNINIKNYFYLFTDKFQENNIFDFNSFDKVIVCQANSLRYSYVNIYSFLLNNGINKCKVIYWDNRIKTFNIKWKIGFIYKSFFLLLSIYNKMGFK